MEEQGLQGVFPLIRPAGTFSPGEKGFSMPDTDETPSPLGEGRGAGEIPVPAVKAQPNTRSASDRAG